MRLYLDTNVLIYLVLGQGDDLDKVTFGMLFDYSNTLYTSIVCVHEFVYLLQSGKVKRGKEWKVDESVIDRLKKFDVSVVPVSELHIREEECLPLLEGHRDPNDRLIIAQAIADKATLVSSDKKFPLYRSYGLSLRTNHR